MVIVPSQSSGKEKLPDDQNNLHYYITKLQKAKPLFDVFRFLPGTDAEKIIPPDGWKNRREYGILVRNGRPSRCPELKEGRRAMKYAETVVAALVLCFGAGMGIALLRRRNAAGRRMALGALLLTLGAAAHLAPRSLGLLFDWDTTHWRGLGRLAAALALTGWYLLLYRSWEREFRPEVRDRVVLWTVIGCVILRLLLMAAPANGWWRNGHDPLWQTLRNLPLAVLAAVTVLLYRLTRRENRALAPVWILQLISFLCYLPAAVGRTPVAVPSMALMALCQLATLACFLRATRK